MRAGAALALLAVCGCSPQASAECPGAMVRVESAAGAVRLEVCAELAQSAEQRKLGLVGEPPLAAGRGLLMVFPLEGDVCISNEQVSFEIDVVYSDDSTQVVAVDHELPAGDAQPRCHRSVRRVLEVAAGTARVVSLGDRLVVGG